MDLSTLALLANMLLGPLAVGFWVLVYLLLLPAASDPMAVDNVVTSCLGVGLWFYIWQIRTGRLA